MKNILFGSVVAIITAAVIIFMIESGRSLLQCAAGFFLFIIPVMFISSFTTKMLSYLLVAFSIFTIYIIVKFGYYDAFAGIFLAVLIGGSVFYHKINRVQPFSTEGYKDAGMGNGRGK